MRSNGVRPTILHLVALVALIAVCLAVGLWLDSKPAGWACGAFPLRVDLEVPQGRTVVAVAAGPESSLEKARSDLGGPFVDVETVSWVAGSSFEVRVPCGSRISMLSHRDLWTWQYRALVLRIDYSDGSTQWLARAIPDCRTQRHLSVAIP